MENESRSPSIEVVPAGFEDRAVLENLMQLYIYDFTQYVEVPLRPDGRFQYSLLSLYWTQPHRYPFFIKVDERLAGFALIKKGSELTGSLDVWDMAEFFVLRGERRHGVGRAAARQIWQRFPGSWEVRVLPANYGAVEFWRKALARFLNRVVEPARVEFGNEFRDVFRFESPAS